MTETRRRVAVSTYLYHGQRLTKAHLHEIAAAGFDGVELRATRSHFDYHAPTAIGDLQEWIAGAGLSLCSVHAPLGEEFTAGRWVNTWSIAAADPSVRARAVAETEQALYIARRLTFPVLIVHLGVPRWAPTAAADNSRDAARRSLETLQEAAAPLGVRVAVELIQNELSRAGPLVHFVESVLDSVDVGICLDLGHAHLDGDEVEAVETLSEHLSAVDLHDNRGRADDHLVPFEGSVDWPGALTALQKVGYEGTLTLELSAQGAAKETLARARKARERLERLMAS